MGELGKMRTIDDTGALSLCRVSLAAAPSAGTTAEILTQIAQRLATVSERLLAYRCLSMLNHVVARSGQKMIE